MGQTNLVEARNINIYRGEQIVDRRKCLDNAVVMRLMSSNIEKTAGEAMEAKRDMLGTSKKYCLGNGGKAIRTGKCPCSGCLLSHCNF